MVQPAPSSETKNGASEPDPVRNRNFERQSRSVCPTSPVSAMKISLASIEQDNFPKQTLHVNTKFELEIKFSVTLQKTIEAAVEPPPFVDGP